MKSMSYRNLFFEAEVVHSQTLFMSVIILCVQIFTIQTDVPMGISTFYCMTLESGFEQLCMPLHLILVDFGTGTCISRNHSFMTFFLAIQLHRIWQTLFCLMYVYFWWKHSTAFSHLLMTGFCVLLRLLVVKL